MTETPAAPDVAPAAAAQRAGEEASLLGALEGRAPPAPEWFTEALAAAPERSRVEVEGAQIETLAWGRRGDPGLLLLHGFAAHADWWSFIAPFLAADGRRVVALSFSGMGNSDWRDVYDLQQHAREAMAVMQAMGLAAGGRPLIFGHSYGSFAALTVARAMGDRLAGVVVADGRLGEDVLPPPVAVRSAHKVYPTEAAALARFRFIPWQSCNNLFVVDHIARQSLKAVEGGFTWRFDPGLAAKRAPFNRSVRMLREAGCPVAVMIGSRSKLMAADLAAAMQEAIPQAPWVVIPDAGHHLMADQPLPLVAAMRGLFAGWPR